VLDRYTVKMSVEQNRGGLVEDWGCEKKGGERKLPPAAYNDPSLKKEGGIKTF